MVNKFWAATFTLIGTMIGAGILGLPYAFSQSGFFTGVFWILLLGIIIILTNLYLGEVCLRTKQKHQLTGYAKKYLGKSGGRLMLFAMLFGIYAALIAYLVGEGQSFSYILTGTASNAIYFGIGFWILITILLEGGIKRLKKVETFAVLVIIAIILGIFIYSIPSISYENLIKTNSNNFFLPFGVVLFSLLGFSSIPELRIEIKKEEKKLGKAIITGVLIASLLYILFPLVFVGILGENIPELATLAFGKSAVLLGMFTMLSSYFVLSFSLRDMFIFDLKFSKTNAFIWASFIPLLFYLIISVFDIASFSMILGIGGVISGGLTGILIMIMNKNAKKKGNRKPEYHIPINKTIIAIISIIYLLGIIFEFIF